MATTTVAMAMATAAGSAAKAAERPRRRRQRQHELGCPSPPRKSDRVLDSWTRSDRAGTPGLIQCVVSGRRSGLYWHGRTRSDGPNVEQLSGLSVQLRPRHSDRFHLICRPSAFVLRDSIAAGTGATGGGGARRGRVEGERCRRTATRDTPIHLEPVAANFSICRYACQGVTRRLSSLSQSAS